MNTKHIRTAARRTALALAFALLPGAAMAGDGKVACTANTGGTVSYFGSEKKENYDVAVMLTGKNLKGLKVESVSVPFMGDNANTSNIRMWITKKLSLVNRKNVVDGPTAEAKLDTAAHVATASFDEPYTIDADTLYVGYSFNVTTLTAKTKMPVAVVANASSLGFFIHSSRTFLKWMDKSALATSAISVTLSGVEANDASFDALGTIYGQKETPTQVAMTLRNLGANPISSIDYSYTQGTVTGNGHLDLATPLAAYYGLSTSVNLTLQAMPTKGDYPLVINLDKVNGQELTGVKSEGNIIVYNVLPKHRAVMEEYTGTWCGWCPRGLVALEVMSRLYPDDFIGLSYHNGDPMAVMESNQFPSSVSGFPNADIDRRFGSVDPYYGVQNEGFGIETLWKKCCEVVAPASVDAEAAYSDDGKTINAKATMVFPVNLTDGDRYKVEFVLVADDLHGEGESWLQKNYYEPTDKAELKFDEAEPFVQGLQKVPGIHFDDVVVATTRLTDGLVSLPATITEDEPVVIEGSFDFEAVKVKQDASKMRVAALLIDTTTGIIANAAKAQVSGAEKTGIESVNADRLQDEPKAYYDLQGRRLNSPRQGLNIIRLASGKSVVVAVK